MTGIVVHGGAGRIPKEMQEDHRRGVARAASIGWDALEHGAVVAVVAAVRYMEGVAPFNAGVCSFPNSDGIIEMDAVVMDDELRTGAVAGITGVRHPVDAALAVMRHSRCVLLAGEGGRRFALEHGVEGCPPEDLLVPEQLDRWGVEWKGAPGDTVGAVALDRHGRLAAAASTGGTIRSPPGRVGDVPVPGAGVYVVRRLGAACATGRGEDIMRVMLARRTLDILETAGPEMAAERAIGEMEGLVDGKGGIIVLDAAGTVGVGRNTKHMPWAAITDEGEMMGGL
ncbi:MAG TPA: peptidase T [Thermoplasmata archaeon]|nr:peptidase T [Thermoplasmata archaeon]